MKQFAGIALFISRPKFIVTAAFLLAVADGALHANQQDRAWEKLRDKAIDRPRNLIFNNDGNEPVVFCKSVSKEEFLRHRATPLIGSQVDSIFYCTWSSGFGMFIHDTKVGQVFSTHEGMFSNNLAPAFLAQGLDPLRMTVDFGHANGMEVFWSFRVNDTHDGSSTEYGPIMFRANKLKAEHPEYLIGSEEKRPKHGAWSAVDYGRLEVRQLALQYCEEVCRNYDIDGIELDFFRHLFLFKCSGRGEPCGETELNQLTDLIGQIRMMMEVEGRRRKCPILLAVRVPDSIEYCKVVGIDLERWLGENLVDLLIVSGYTQLNPWEYSVELGRKYGVKVYPSLDESRVRDETARKMRDTVEAYRGRALNVWNSGADGVYLFNFFNADSPVLREVGDVKGLRKLDRTYFASVRGVGSVPVPHKEFIRVPVLNPASPVSLNARESAKVEFTVGEDLKRIPRGQNISLRLQFRNVSDVDDLQITLNGKPLSDGQPVGDWFEWKLAGKAFRKGGNAVELKTARPKKSVFLTDLSVVVGVK